MGLLRPFPRTRSDPRLLTGFPSRRLRRSGLQKFRPIRLGLLAVTSPPVLAPSPVSANFDVGPSAVSRYALTDSQIVVERLSGNLSRGGGPKSRTALHESPTGPVAVRLSEGLIWPALNADGLPGLTPTKVDLEHRCLRRRGTFRTEIAVVNDAAIEIVLCLPNKQSGGEGADAGLQGDQAAAHLFGPPCDG